MTPNSFPGIWNGCITEDLCKFVQFRMLPFSSGLYTLKNAVIVFGIGYQDKGIFTFHFHDVFFCGI